MREIKAKRIMKVINKIKDQIIINKIQKKTLSNINMRNYGKKG